MCIQKFFKFFCSLLLLQKEMLCSQRSWEGYIWGRLKKEKEKLDEEHKAFYKKSSYFLVCFTPDKTLQLLMK